MSETAPMEPKRFAQELFLRGLAYSQSDAIAKLRDFESQWATHTEKEALVTRAFRKRMAESPPPKETDPGFDAWMKETRRLMAAAREAVE